ncbi:MAG: hypothetical protein PHP17_00010 [Candidatus Omnitrophica bacterium]|nr:hypothetical protein [Candidatus Omnitrophota bacterium]
MIKKNKKILLRLFLVFSIFFLALKFLIPAIITINNELIDFIEQAYIGIAIFFLLAYLAWGLENKNNIIKKILSYTAKAILYLLFGYILIKSLVQNVMDWF